MFCLQIDNQQQQQQQQEDNNVGTTTGKAMQKSDREATSYIEWELKKKHI